MRGKSGVSPIADHDILLEALHDINVGITIFDSDDHLIWWNNAYRQFWPGLSDRIAVGLSKAELTVMIHERGTELWVPVPHSWLDETGHPLGPFAHVSRLADGRWVHIHAAPLPSGCYVTCISDISELKARDMRDLAIELAERNALVLGDDYALKEATVTFQPGTSAPLWTGPIEDLLLLDLDQRDAITTYNELAAVCRKTFLFCDLDELDQLLGGDLTSLVRQIRGEQHFISVRRTTSADGTVMVRFVDVNDQFNLDHIVQSSDSTRYRDLQKVVDGLNNDILSVTHRLQDEISIRRKIERDLIKSSEEAERSHLLTSRFVAAVGHDLMQPLNAARLFISTLNNSRLSGQSRQMAGKALRALDFSSQLIESLLDLSKIELGLTKPVFESLEFDEILSDLYAEFLPEAKARDLFLEVSYCGHIITSDRVLVRRIIQNFLANAIAHTTSGVVSVSQRVIAGELRIAVTDTGSGIARDAQSDIFSEFTRIPSADANASHGLGLGLAIAAGASRLIGGRIRLASRPSIGSRFSLTVPLAPGASHTSPIDTSHNAGDCRSVLIIEDHDLTSDAMSSLLQSWGYCTYVGRNMKEGLEFVEKGLHVDWIISDYHLGNAEVGTVAVRRLRDALDVSIPALIITADRSPEVRQAIELEGIEVVFKPLAPEALRDFLSKNPA